MIRREIKINFKSFIIWFSILAGIFLVAFLMYPAIISGENIEMLNEMMKVFPEEVLIAFNMDISSMDTVFGWLKSEGFTFVLLVVGCYSGIMGSNILLKEESDKTIEYLNSLPIKRSDIVFSRVVVGLLYVLGLTLLIGIFNYIGLYFSGEFDVKQYLLLSITPIFSSVVIFFLCMALSTFTHKTKKMLGVSLGIVFIMYMLSTFSAMAKEIEFLKYFSVFTLSDIRNVIVDVKINPVMVLISVLLSVVFLVITVVRYNKKELM